MPCLTKQYLVKSINRKEQTNFYILMNNHLVPTWLDLINNIFYMNNKLATLNKNTDLLQSANLMV
jgi:ABC-type Mn2+/Zn2+ transport system ATPase subunit